jgi:hypothetical protein
MRSVTLERSTSTARVLKSSHATSSGVVVLPAISKITMPSVAMFRPHPSAS